MRRERRKMESCPCLSRVSKDRGVLQERQQISQRERAADQRKLSAHLLLVERSYVEELGG